MPKLTAARNEVPARVALAKRGLPSLRLRTATLCFILWALPGVADAQVTVTPSAPALRTVCVSNTGALTFDGNSTSTCAGAQTAITSLTVTNGGGFTAAGTAGFSATGTGAVTTNSGNIASTSGAITTGSGNISTTSGNLNVGGTSNFLGALSNSAGNLVLDDDVDVSGHQTVGGTLGVTGATTTNGITNTGNIGTTTLSTTGAATVGNGLTVSAGGANISGGLNNTNGGITNAGAISGATNITASGTVQGGTITDGTALMTGGNISGVGTLAATTGNITTVNATAVNATTVNAPTINSTTINNSGTLTTAALAVGAGGVSVAGGAPVSMGGNRIQNVGTPIAPTDAATKAYVDNFLGASNAALTERINSAFDEIDRNTEGIAVAIALGGLALPSGKGFALGANLGFYDDKQAAAAQAALRLDDHVQLNAGLGVGFDHNKVGGRVGIMAAW